MRPAPPIKHCINGSRVQIFLYIANKGAAMAQRPTLETERLVLRAWKESDAEELYRHAKDPRIGPIAGWKPHESVEYSRGIIRDVLSTPETYAVVLRETGLPVGSVGLLFGDASNVELGDDEAEVGYWIGHACWGKGLIPEAVREIQRHAFDDLGLQALWCAYYDGNRNSLRVQQKCGFEPHHTVEGARLEFLDETRPEHFTRLTRNRWLAINS